MQLVLSYFIVFRVRRPHSPNRCQEESVCLRGSDIHTGFSECLLNRLRPTVFVCFTAFHFSWRSRKSIHKKDDLIVPEFQYLLKICHRSKCARVFMPEFPHGKPFFIFLTLSRAMRPFYMADIFNIHVRPRVQSTTRLRIIQEVGVLTR